ncbi:MAG: hypothetical protein GTN99_02925 [Candidatus Dadabacteria bacterium]|nr:hypothetical protein [Candidatus Dadabacteria bacterium]
MKELMVDLETLDVKPTAVVVSFAAIPFDMDKKLSFIEMVDGGHPVLYHKLAVEPQITGGRTVSASTLGWWLTQEEDARTDIALACGKENPLLDLHGPLCRFYEFAKEYECERIWGNGPSFDNAILRSLFDDLETEFPFKYNVDRDLRTLVDMTQESYVVETPEGMVPHHPVHDAAFQIVRAQIAWQKISKLIEARSVS